MHAIFHAILRTISIQSPDHDTQALERAPVFCGARVFFDAVGAALRVAIEAGQTKGLNLRHCATHPRLTIVLKTTNWPVTFLKMDWRPFR